MFPPRPPPLFKLNTEISNVAGAIVSIRTLAVVFALITHGPIFARIRIVVRGEVKLAISILFCKSAQFPLEISKTSSKRTRDNVVLSLLSRTSLSTKRRSQLFDFLVKRASIVTGAAE